ncbi:MAG: hypothetical protein HYS07_00375 [Chlamydiae bacterium]|nr:hypothetical protein [Chlamydiota bacterium]MBI3278114.1 hypothetical protein [Chlamydiota bacterium]
MKRVIVFLCFFSLAIGKNGYASHSTEQPDTTGECEPESDCNVGDLPISGSVEGFSDFSIDIHDLNHNVVASATATTGTITVPSINFGVVIASSSSAVYTFPQHIVAHFDDNNIKRSIRIYTDNFTDCEVESYSDGGSLSSKRMRDNMFLWKNIGGEECDESTKDGLDSKYTAAGTACTDGTGGTTTVADTYVDGRGEESDEDKDADGKEDDLTEDNRDEVYTDKDGNPDTCNNNSTLGSGKGGAAGEDCLVTATTPQVAGIVVNPPDAQHVDYWVKGCAYDAKLGKYFLNCGGEDSTSDPNYGNCLDEVYTSGSTNDGTFIDVGGEDSDDDGDGIDEVYTEKTYVSGTCTQDTSVTSDYSDKFQSNPPPMFWAVMSSDNTSDLNEGQYLFTGDTTKEAYVTEINKEDDPNTYWDDSFVNSYSNVGFSISYQIALLAGFPCCASSSSETADLTCGSSNSDGSANSDTNGNGTASECDVNISYPSDGDCASSGDTDKNGNGQCDYDFRQIIDGEFAIYLGYKPTTAGKWTFNLVLEIYTEE